VSVLVLWGLAASHCELEHLSGWEWLGCGPAGGSGPHQSADCEGDACSIIESGLYRLEDPPAWVLPPLLALAVALPAPEVIIPPSYFRHAAPVAAPVELAPGWQFAFRAALPPRAPNRPA
jgi:hypothetical protein